VTLFVAGLVTSCGSGSNGSASASADSGFCDVLAHYEASIRERAELTEAQGNPFAQVAVALGSYGELDAMLVDLADEAPEELTQHFDRVRATLQTQLDSLGQAGSDPIGAALSSLVTGLANEPSFEAIDGYAEDECGTAIFRAALTSGSDGTTDWSSGLVLASCPGLAQIELVDPASGSTLATRSFGSSAQPTRLCGLQSWHAVSIRSMFSHDFAYAAVTTDGSDGSNRVGVIDTATDTFIDLTALHEESGFSAAIADDRSPGFVLGTDTLRFYDANRDAFFEATPEDGWQPRLWRPASGTYSDDGVTYLPGDVVVGSGAFSTIKLPDPSGEWYTDGESVRHRSWREPRFLDVPVDEECAPTDWLSGPRVLCVAEPDEQAAILTFNAACTSYTVEQVTDAPDRTMHDLVASPDGSTVAFLSTRRRLPGRGCQLIARAKRRASAFEPDGRRPRIVNGNHQGATIRGDNTGAVNPLVRVDAELRRTGRRLERKLRA
jgi:hypothetical protein